MEMLLTVIGLLVLWMAAALLFDQWDDFESEWQRCGLRCAIGWHKWFTLRGAYCHQIEWEVKDAVGGKLNVDVGHNGLLFDYRRDRVCLRCERRDDQIIAYGDRFRAKYLRRLKLESHYLGETIASRRKRPPPPPPPPPIRETVRVMRWGGDDAWVNVDPMKATPEPTNDCRPD